MMLDAAKATDPVIRPPIVTLSDTIFGDFSIDLVGPSVPRGPVDPTSVTRPSAELATLLLVGEPALGDNLSAPGVEESC